MPKKSKHNTLDLELNKNFIIHNILYIPIPAIKRVPGSYAKKVFGNLKLKIFNNYRI